LNLPTIVGGLFATAVFIGLAIAPRSPLSGIATIVVGIAGVAVAYRFSVGRKKHQKVVYDTTTQFRYELLVAQAQDPGFRLEVQGASGLWIALPLILAGTAFFGLGLEKHSVPGMMAGSVVGMALGVVFFLLGLTGLAKAIPALGKPKLTLTAAGLQTPGLPFVAWEEVDGLSLRENRHRGRLISYSLTFLVPALASQMAAAAPVERWFWALRGQARRNHLHVMLGASNEPPEAVYQLGRHLWSTRTGKTHAWHADLPAKVNAAMRGLDADMKKLERLHEAAPTEVAKLQESIARNTRTTTRELARRRRILNWLSASALVVFLIHVAVHFMR
jgi:hypothetical protein